jgi:hypothetical protein
VRLVTSRETLSALGRRQPSTTISPANFAPRLRIAKQAFAARSHRDVRAGNKSVGDGYSAVARRGKQVDGGPLSGGSLGFVARGDRGRLRALTYSDEVCA